MKTKFITLFFAILLVSAPEIWAAGDSEIIRVMYIARWSAYRNRFDKMVDADPAVDVLGVPMPGTFSIGKGYIDAEDLNRRMRIYMPRTLEQLVTERDLVVMQDAPRGHHEVAEVYFDPKWIFWFVEGVKGRGLDLAMWGGDASWGGGGEGDYPSWGETPLDEVLPLRSGRGYNLYGLHRRVFRDPEHPLARIPWGESPPIEHVNMAEAKQGAITVAEASSGRKSYPWVAYWDIGTARVVGETEVFGSEGTTHVHDIMRRNWVWYQDFLIYMVYFSTGRSIPDDVYQAHRIRNEINLYASRASLMISLLEFVSAFGASTGELFDHLENMDAMERWAEDHFREGEYEAAAEVFDELEEHWRDLDSMAAGTKKRALFWVYMIEWSSVTSMGLLAGILVWVLMVRRRFYREVGITRGSRGVI